MARRFIVAEENFMLDEKTLKVTITGKEVKHIQVLRHKIGDLVTVNAYQCQIKEIKRDAILLAILGEAKKVGEPTIQITLYTAILKGDKTDFVVQKAVELGVSTIVPCITTNVVVKLDEKSSKKKQEKWQLHAEEACKQCGRTDSVKIEKIISFNDLIKKIEEEEAVLFAYEKETSSLHKALDDIRENNIQKLGIVIGAEGGFTPKEAKQLQAKDNVFSISLGSRILKAETANLSMLSIAMYELENFDK